MLIPFIQYHDAPGAIAWLQRAFGFKPHLVVSGEDNAVAHAQLLLGERNMLMASSRKAGGVAAQAKSDASAAAGIYVVVDDPDAHYQRALQAGAEMVMDIEDQDYGGRGYTCLDIEGNLWSFGSYDPFAEIS